MIEFVLETLFFIFEIQPKNPWLRAVWWFFWIVVVAFIAEAGFGFFSGC